MRPNQTLLFFLLSFVTTLGFGQMIDPVTQDTLFGNEWIDFDKTYYKIPVAADGMVRLNGSQLPSELQNVAASELRLFRMGQQIALHTSTDGNLGANDYLEFYGAQNRSELDRHLFDNPDADMLNPEYSLYTDTAVYYLVRAIDEPSVRFQTMDNDLTGSLPPAQEWFPHETRLTFTGQLTKRYQKVAGLDIYYSHFENGEGWASPLGGANPAMSLSPQGVHSSNTEATLGMKLATNVGAHNMVLKVNGEVVLEQAEGFGYQHLDYSVDLPYTDATGNLTVTIEDTDPDNTNRQAISNVWLNYRHGYDFQNQNQFTWTVDEPDALYFEIDNFGGTAPVLYDLTNGTRTVAEVDGGLVKVTLPAGDSPRRLVLVGENGIATASAPVAHQFTDYRSMDAEMVLLTHPFFLNAPGDPIGQYVNYRQNRMTVQTVDITELYEQFAYGVQRTPIAIRNFAHWIRREWASPKYFFMVGKGREYNVLRTPAQLAAAQETFFIPAFGWPASDNLLLSDNDSPVPIFAVGRLPAVSPQGMEVYLDKLIGQEANVNLPHGLESNAWTKEIIHLGGGTTTGEQNSIQSGLRSMENVVELSRLAAEVESFYKNSGDLTSSSQSTQVIDKINEGVSLVTFFGHSSPGLFDFDIDNPEAYSNENKYPVIISLGCYSGNIFTSSIGTGERFVNYEKKGAILFGATRGFGFVSSLTSFGTNFYDQLGNRFDEISVAQAVRQTLEQFSSATDIGMATLVEQYTITGDPSYVLPIERTAPDLIVDPSSIQFEPRQLTSELDSFIVNFDVLNLGLNLVPGDTVRFDFKLKYPNNSEAEFKGLVGEVERFRNEIQYKLPINGTQAVGINRLFITVDPENLISEAPATPAESNNELLDGLGTPGFSFAVRGTAARPSYPLDYGIVGESEDFELIALSSDLISPEVEYVWQLDVSKSFNSPERIEYRSAAPGGVLRWRPQVNLVDNTVYFWRIAPVPNENGEPINWETSSFVYLMDSPAGWNQSTGEQLSENSLNLMNNDSITNELRMGDVFWDFKLKNKYYESSDQPRGFVNGFRWSDYFRWENNYTINFVVFELGDKLWFNYRNQDGVGQYGSLNTQRPAIACFAFPATTQEGRADAINFLENIVPDGHLVITYTALRNTNATASDWSLDSLNLNGKNIFNVMEAHGSSQIRSLENNLRPWTFGFIKGGEVFNELAYTPEEPTTIFQYDIPQKSNEGKFASKLIGPSNGFTDISWKIDGYQPGSLADSLWLSVHAVAPDGSEYQVLAGNDTLFTQSLANIDATQYPYLRVNYYALDWYERTNPTVDYLRVRYEPLPDLTFATNQLYEVSSDSLDRGEPYRLRTQVINLVPNTDVEDVVLRLRARADSGAETIIEKVVPGFSADTLREVALEFETTSLQGAQQLILEVNPDLLQPEVTGINNSISSKLTVLQDVRNPTLDVTFDGIKIMNGDIVSARPLIEIQIRDENEIFLLQDSSLFQLQVTDPKGNVTTYPAGHPSVRFLPATDRNDNQARVEFRKDFEEDGRYRLKAQARDVANNVAGSQTYDVEFEVINSSTISNVLNYPNPFTTSTRFVYTLTGSDVNMDYRLRIYSASGRIVRELGPADLGQLRIGTHQTDFAWDGTDTYGDRLAKGVYFYRFEVRNNSEEIPEQRENQTIDRYFEQGFGKLVIL